MSVRRLPGKAEPGPGRVARRGRPGSLVRPAAARRVGAGSGTRRPARPARVSCPSGGGPTSWSRVRDPSPGEDGQGLLSVRRLPGKAEPGPGCVARRGRPGSLVRPATARQGGAGSGTRRPARPARVSCPSGGGTASWSRVRDASPGEDGQGLVSVRRLPGKAEPGPGRVARRGWPGSRVRPAVARQGGAGSGTRRPARPARVSCPSGGGPTSWSRVRDASPGEDGQGLVSVRRLPGKAEPGPGRVARRGRRRLRACRSGGERA